mmetsp:Transcript_71894/g.200658  ORF Transcript_71894/g.200658 Transcript_71894/m.200658 type:complete len:263 (+) Transcript_71894:1829-2617(+)
MPAADASQVPRGDHLVREQLEDVQGPVGDLPAAREDGGERAEGQWEAPRLDGLAGQLHGPPRLGQARVHECRADVEEGRAEAQRQEALAEAAEEVDGTRVAGVVAERHQSLVPAVARLGDALVIHEAYLPLQNRVQQGHAGRLRLDGVGEEEPGAAWQEEVNGHLLDGADRGALREVLVDLCTRAAVLVVGKDSPCRGLHDDANALADEGAHVIGRHGRSPLPLVLVLAADSQYPRAAPVLSLGAAVRTDRTARARHRPVPL